MQRQHVLVQCFRRRRRDAGGNDAQHHGIGVVELEGSRAESRGFARLPTDLTHCVMTGLAVEQDELGLKSFGRVLRVQHRIHASDETDCLSNSPDLHVVYRSLAFDILWADSIMRRLRRRVSVELKAHARMARTHDQVGDEPVFVARITKMAGQALFGAGDRLLGRVEPGVEVRFMAGAGEVDAEPLFSAAMTGLAADPVRNIETRASPRFWYVI